MSLTLFLSCATNKLVSYISLLLWNTMVKISLFTIDHFTFQRRNQSFLIVSFNLDIEWVRFVYNIQFYHILPILDFLLPDSKRTGGTYLL